MSKFLQTIIGADDKKAVFSAGINQLERLTGQKGVDTRLIADILEKAHEIMRRLGLDVADTTGRELYFALLGTVESDSIEDILADSDYLLLKLDGVVISFNMIDVIENAHHHLPYGKQVINHGQRSLRGELVSRYLNLSAHDESQARDVASMIGLLDKNDMWYNKSIYKHKHSKKLREN